jgi:beta-lactamase class C
MAFLICLGAVLMRFIYLFICLLFWACFNTTAPEQRTPASAPKPALDPAFKALLDDYAAWFETEMRYNGSPGAALVVVKDSSIVLARGFGVCKSGTANAVDSNTIFRIGSLSKGFAGVLSAIMVQEGRFAWDDPVEKHYPEFVLRDAAQTKRLRIAHLLSHSTGLPYHAYTNLLEEGWGVPRIIREYFPRARLGGKEGAFFAYQNVAFCGIEEVIRHTSGADYPTQLRQRIFAPLGMASASCDFVSIRYAANHAMPHFWTGNYWASDSISTLYYDAVAAGGVNASIMDMGRWLTLLLGHRPGVIGPRGLDAVFQPRLSTEKERQILRGWISGKEASYGFGWRVLTPGTDTILYHAGYVNGYRGEIAFDRKAQVGVCALFNAAAPMAVDVVPEFFRRIKPRQ